MNLKAGPKFLPGTFLPFLALSLLLGALLSLGGRPVRADDASAKRYALVIANGNYPDANIPLPSATKDGEAFASELQRYGFSVDFRHDLSKENMQSTVKSFLDKITQGSTALLYFNGIGIQVSHQTYLIPVNAELWSETDVKRDGVSIDSVLAEMNRRGARVKIAIIDAARRNPFERRFRAYSAGLAGIDAPEGTLVMYAAAPNKIAKDGSGADVSLFMSELLKELRTPGISAEEAMTHTRVGVSRASNGEQVPWVASSLVDPFYFGRTSPQNAPAPAPTQEAERTPPPQKPTPKPEPPAPQPQAETKAPAPAPESKPEAQQQPKPEAQPPAPAPEAKPAQPAEPESSTSEQSNQEPSKPEQSKPAEPPAKEPSAPAPSAQTESATPKPDTPPSPPSPPEKPQAPPTEQAEQTPPPQAAPPSPAPPKDLKPGVVFQDCPDCPEMVVLPGGSFEMGTGKTPYDRPVHKVTIAKPFALGQSEVTFTEWNECAAEDGCKAHPDNQGWGGGDRPVINVSWFDAKEYVAWLSKKTGKRYRLPSEAEWEYAARGGAPTPFWWGASVGTNQANCVDCGAGGAGKQTVPVKSFKPNGFGLFDMSGNAAEWVEDCWTASYKKAPPDGSAMVDGNCAQRGLRGGSFDSTSAYIKPAARFRYDADVRYWANGFRVARDIP